MAAALKVAIVGGGFIGDVHRRAALLAGADIVGVLGSDTDSSRRLAERWNVTTGFDGIDQLAASDVDVVHICSPNATHVPYAVTLMRAGKHVVCEKPLGLGVDDAAEASAAAEAAGVVNVVPFVYRYHPMVREMRARVQDPAFGSVNLIHGSYLQDWMLDPRASSWRVDPAVGGPSRAFGDIGSHWCDLAEWVTGQRFTSLVATTSIAVPQRPAASAASFSAADDDAPLVDVLTEDIAAVLLRTAGGTTGSTTISQVSPGRKNRLWLEVDGAQRSAVFDQENPEHLWVGDEAGALLLSRDPNHGSAEQRRLSVLPAGHPQGYAQCFENFVADAYTAVRAHRDHTPELVPEGLPTFADGLRAATICAAMLDSARDGGWVQMPPG